MSLTSLLIIVLIPIAYALVVGLISNTNPSNYDDYSTSSTASETDSEDSLEL